MTNMALISTAMVHTMPVCVHFSIKLTFTDQTARFKNLEVLFSDPIYSILLFIVYSMFQK